VNNDYSLVLKAKEGDQKSKLELFNKYEGLIKKKYLVFRLLGEYTVIDYNDFKSESFFSFMSALNYIDISKITNPEKWKFLGVFSWYLSTLLKSQIEAFSRTKWRNQENISIYAYLDDGVHTILDTIEDDSHLEDMVIMKTMVSDFEDSLTPQEKIIFEHRFIKNVTKKSTLMSIAKDIGFSYNKVQRICKNLEHRAKNFAFGV